MGAGVPGVPAPVPPARLRPTWVSPMCYSRRMEVASRTLRNRTREVLDRVEGGEEVVITVDGRPVAVLRPLAERPRWVTRQDFLRRFAERQADPALREELATLAPGTTDDLEL